MKLSLCALSAVFFSSSAESEAKTGVRGHRFLQDGGGGGGGGGMGGGGGGGRGGTTCSATVAPSFGSNPSNGACITTFQRGSAYAYPEDFPVLSKVSLYTCPTSERRVIVSNGIPDHDITLDNPNQPCEINWMISLPLSPTLSTTLTEPAALGIIGMSLNGVPSYGAQEGGGTNAVEGDGAIVVPYYGHAAPTGDWHYHSGEFGHYETIEEVPSTELLGYAMDGFPIYGPLEDASVLDECNGIGDTSETYRYHVLTKPEVNETLGYCDGTSPAINWKYTLGCFHGDLSSSTVADSTTTALPSDCVLEVADAPTVTPVTPVAPTEPPVPTGGEWSYTLPNWWDLIGETHEGDDLKRCFKRENPPTVGTSCATTAKTCYWGDQPCGADGSIPYPTTTCHCDGKPNLPGTWSCEPVVCPTRRE